jgi:hypothetical protein
MQQPDKCTLLQTLDRVGWDGLHHHHSGRIESNRSVD